MKNSDLAAAAYWRFLSGTIDLFQLPEDKQMEAFVERLEAFKAQWPDYPTPNLDATLANA